MSSRTEEHPDRSGAARRCSAVGRGQQFPCRRQSPSLRGQLKRLLSVSTSRFDLKIKKIIKIKSTCFHSSGTRTARLGRIYGQAASAVSISDTAGRAVTADVRTKHWSMLEGSRWESHTPACMCSNSIVLTHHLTYYLNLLPSFLFSFT